MSTEMRKQFVKDKSLSAVRESIEKVEEAARLATRSPGRPSPAGLSASLARLLRYLRQEEERIKNIPITATDRRAAKIRAEQEGAARR